MPRPAPQRELVPIPTYPAPEPDAPYDEFKGYVLDVYADRLVAGRCDNCGPVDMHRTMLHGEVTDMCKKCLLFYPKGYPLRKPSLFDAAFQYFEPVLRTIFEKSQPVNPFADIVALGDHMFSTLGIPASLMRPGS